MRIVVATCWKYRDAWRPMCELLYRFYAPRPKVWLATDEVFIDTTYFNLGSLVDGFHWTANPASSWCDVVASACVDNESILLLQEDFFINASVNIELVEHGLKLLHHSQRNIGAVRLYPMPGATDASDDPYYGPVSRYSMYRTSCQATLWKPSYLLAIASRFRTPTEFEIEGSSWAAATRNEEVWAFKRDVQPWPISYYCSAISRGKWDPAALEFCRHHGIDVDTSMREVACS